MMPQSNLDDATVQIFAAFENFIAVLYKLIAGIWKSG